MFKLSQRKNASKIVAIALMLAFAVPIGAEPVFNLTTWYAGYNQKYFNGELPANTKINHLLVDPEKMAETEWYADSGLYVIRMNIKFEPSGNQAQMTLIHEMCHIYLEQNGEDDFLAPRYHGPHFQACMLDLAEKGAFNDLW